MYQVTSNQEQEQELGLSLYLLSWSVITPPLYWAEVHMPCVSVLSLYAGGAKQGTGAVSHIGRVLTLTRPPASSYNPYGGSIGDNISETATDYCLSYV